MDLSSFTHVTVFEHLTALTVCQALYQSPASHISSFIIKIGKDMLCGRENTIILFKK